MCSYLGWVPEWAGACSLPLRFPPGIRRNSNKASPYWVSLALLFIILNPPQCKPAPGSAHETFEQQSGMKIFSIFRLFQGFFIGCPYFLGGVPYFFDFLLQKKTFFFFFTFCIVHSYKLKLQSVKYSSMSIFLHIFVKKSRFIINTCH